MRTYLLTTVLGESERFILMRNVEAQRARLKYYFSRKVFFQLSAAAGALRRSDIAKKINFLNYSARPKNLRLGEVPLCSVDTASAPYIR